MTPSLVNALWLRNVGRIANYFEKYLAKIMSRWLCIASQTHVTKKRKWMLTFFPAQSGPWKCGARTCCIISSSPLSVAFPMTVIGVSLLTKRLCFRSALLAASAQIACTNETGSTGGRVLKNTTRPHQMINIRHLQRLIIPQSVSNLM